MSLGSRRVKNDCLFSFFCHNISPLLPPSLCVREMMPDVPLESKRSKRLYLRSSTRLAIQRVQRRAQRDARSGF